MTPDEWWTRWCVLWYAIGWRGVAAKQNYNTDDVLDLFAALLGRVARLEVEVQCRVPLGPFLGGLL